MSHFRAARVEHEGKVFEVTLAELEPLESKGDYWHGPASPSTWLAVTVFQAIRRKFPELPERRLLELAGASMGITADKLVSSIEWHENYMRWHDGDPDYRVL